jgi:predicted dehydrogenase
MCPGATIAVLRLTAAHRDVEIEDADVVLNRIEDAIEFNADAAIIACPASAHEEVACALAKSGVNLLIEKPLAMTAASARNIVDCCAESGVVCMIGYNLRYKHSFIELRRLLGTMAIGKILSVRAEVGQYLPSWRPAQDYRTSVSARADLGGGALLELSHELDYLIALFGMPESVHCVMGHYSDLSLDVEDLVELTMSYNHPKIIVSAHLDFLQHRPTRQCKIIGSSGILIWDAVADTVNISLANSNASNTCFGPFGSDSNKAYVDELAAFIQAVSLGSASAPTMGDGLNVMIVADAARAAAVTSAAVMIGNSHG